MKYTFLILLVCLCFCKGKTNLKTSNINSTQVPADTSKIARSPYLHNLIDKYGKAKVLTAYYYLNKESLNKKAFQIDSSGVYYCSIGAYIANSLKFSDSLVQNAEDFLDRLSSVQRGQSISDLLKWLKNETLLNSVLNDNFTEGLYFEELIYDIPETKHIITQYLKGPNQYWGSLDENQMCRVYYDVCVFLLKLDDKARIVFFRNYFEMASKIASTDARK